MTTTPQYSSKYKTILITAQAASLQKFKKNVTDQFSDITEEWINKVSACIKENKMHREGTVLLLSPSIRITKAIIKYANTRNIYIVYDLRKPDLKYKIGNRDYFFIESKVKFKS